MNDMKAKAIARAAQKLVERGEHFSWAGLTHIAKESGVPRATTYRYLERMVSLGLLKKEKRTWRGEVCYRYRLTSAGKHWL